MSNAALFKGLEHVVVKLGLVRNGENPVFRCVPFELLELKESGGTSGVDRLKQFAIELFGGTSDSSAKLAKYYVSLSYNDSDGDTVLIFADRDLICAMKEYALIGKMKILAEVSAKETPENLSRASASTQTFVFNVEGPAPQTEESQPTSERNETNTDQAHTRASTYTAVNETPPELSSSIADILRFAANVASSATSTHAAKVVNDAMKHANRATVTVEEQAKKAADAAQAGVDHGPPFVVRNPARAARQANRCARKAARVARRSMVATSPEADVVELECAVGSIPPNGVKSNRNSEHTNESDSPKSNAETEVKPSSTVVRPFIHGRHTCDACLTTPIVGKRFHAVNHPDYDLCERCFTNYQGGHFKFEEEKLDRDLTYQDRWHVRRNQSICRRQGGKINVRAAPIPPPAPKHPLEHPPCAWSQATADQGDLAMKEAIRRSLEDQKNCETTKEDSDSSKEKLVVETVDVSDPDYKEALDSSRLVLKDPIQEIAAQVQDSPSPTEPDIEVFFGKQDEEEKEINRLKLEAIPAASSAEIGAPASTVSEVESVDLEKAKSFSFVNEEEGDTAALLGSTLDRMAEAIDGLKWELDQPVAPECKASQNLEQDVVGEGEKIVDGDEDDDDDTEDDEEASQYSWQVVAEEEQIARAAQLLGSALFNSEIEQTNESMSALSNSQTTHASAATGLSALLTVPSTVQSLGLESLVPPVQLSRWAVQLEQLHELGFTNDAVSVDILESLSAANIGVDSEDEVSVQQVVNVMIRD